MYMTSIAPHVPDAVYKSAAKPGVAVSAASHTVTP
ncbi:hypothetical protein ABIC47_001378 [Leifsonia sp. 563]